MARAKDCRRELRSSGDVVLLARFVDRAREPLGPTDVCAIEFSIRRLGGDAVDGRKGAGGCDGIALNVHEVICDSLRRDNLWAVDDVGYNFCHRIRLGDFRKACDEPGTHYELRYLVTQTTGDKTVVCFKLRMF